MAGSGKNISLMKLSDFDFTLPEELIAQVPLPERDQSRLMVVDRSAGTIIHDHFGSFANYLAPNSLLVLNNTRVLPAKLTAFKKGAGKPIEMLMVQEETSGTWQVLLKGLGRLRPGQEFLLDDGRITAVFLEQQEDIGIFRFSPDGVVPRFMEKLGKVPLPHYIRRNQADDELAKLDRQRYQTVFARHSGAIAAPTAGLHFTEETIRRLGGKIAYLTLHVGPGTFQPIREDNIVGHKMKSESYIIPVDTWNRVVLAKQEGSKVMAVGTTATRVLETVEFNSTKTEDISGWTDRFIYPGQAFKNTDGLLTNFHLPKSTLYLLVCAFAGRSLMQEAYMKAVRGKYRFFSYGDAMLIL